MSFRQAAKRALKRISGRENGWMTDVNHQLSKALVQMYEAPTLFVLEDLTGVSFDSNNLNNKTKEQKNKLRSWAFYQFEQFLTYKAMEASSRVITVSPDYTSQRCPKCGRIRKENRDHEKHVYVCDKCGYTSNDDRIGAMNVFALAIEYINGVKDPKIIKGSC